MKHEFLNKEPLLEIKGLILSQPGGWVCRV